MDSYAITSELPISYSLKKTAIKHLWRWDRLLTTQLLCLLIVGIMAVDSASRISQEPYLSYMASLQLQWICVGLLGFAFFSIVPYKWLSYLAIPMYGVSVILLILTLKYGVKVNGSRRWFGRSWYKFQPSEFAKLALIFFAAYVMLKLFRSTDFSFWKAIASSLVVLPIFSLVLIQPDLGTALSIMGIFVGMVMARGFSFKTAAIVIGLCAVAAIICWPYADKVLSPHQVDRINVLIDPDCDPQGTGYHLRQSKIAIGSGRLLGNGFSHGSQHRLDFLPENHTDFIFAVIAEDWGFVGVIFVMFLYCSFLYRSCQVAAKSKDSLGILLTMGVVSMLGFQAVVNMAMIIGLMPITGLPLPLISYGGTSMITTMAAIGLIFNVNLRGNR